MHLELSCQTHQVIKSGRPSIIHHNIKMVPPGSSVSRSRGHKEAAGAGSPDTHVTYHSCINACLSLQWWTNGGYFTVTLKSMTTNLGLWMAMPDK